MARNFYYYTRNSYTGGMNNSDEPDQLREDECVLIQNGITNAVGYLDKRSGNSYVGNIATTITTPDFTGSGLDDLTASGSFDELTASTDYVVEIDAEGTPDTFKWSNDDGTTWEAEGVEATGAAQELENGISITFGADTGHTLGESWSFTTSMTDNPILGLATLITDAGVSKELRIQTTKLEYNNSGTWTEIGSDEFTTGLDAFFTQAGNKIYISNGTDNNMSYDGTTLTDLGNTTYPKGKYSDFWKNYLFVCGDGVLNGTTYKNRVWFSDLGDPDTFTTGTNYFDVGKSDGQAITGIASLGEFLVIFKRKSIYILSGSSPDAWILSDGVNNISQIANGIGCVSAKSIVRVGNDLWFMSDDGIRSVRRNEQGSIPLMGLVSGNMNGTISEINWSYAHRIAGTYFDNKVYMAIPTGTSTTNDTVMVANTAIQLDKQTNPHPWFVYTGWEPYCFSIHLGGTTPELHYGDSTTTNVIQAETGNIDYTSSTGIDFDIKGMMIDLKVPEMKKTARFMKYGVSGSGNYNLAFYSSTEGNTWKFRENINLQQGDVWDTGVWGTDDWSYLNEIKGKIALKIGSPQLMLRFRNTGNNQPITLYPYTVAIKQRKLK
jgi:hypothetical protein